MAREGDRLIEGVLGAAGENLIGHASLLNALDLRLRAAEIVITGTGERAQVLVAAALAIPFTDPDRPARAPTLRPARSTSGARAGRRLARARARGFVCIGTVCSLP